MNQDYALLIKAIINEQESIIGPVAYEQVKSVEGLNYDRSKDVVEIVGNPGRVIEDLVEVFRQIFGNVSIDACKSAVHRAVPDMPQDKLPQILRG